MLENPYWLIVLSVFMHVAWNLLARHVDSKANYLWWGLLAHLVLLGPYAVWSLIAHADWNTTLLFALLCTCFANSFYFVALRQAYHFAPVALVYPVARSSPLLIACWSWWFFAGEFTWLEFLAIFTGVMGLWILAATSRQGDTRHAIRWATLAALGTSIYSISDKVAVPFLPGFAEQLGFISVGYACSFLTLSYIQKRSTGDWYPQARPPWRFILLGGLCIGTAYALVVRAMKDLPAAHTVAFTNAGIVLAVLLSIFLFKEKDHWPQRLLGALVVSMGLVLLGVLA